MNLIEQAGLRASKAYEVKRRLPNGRQLEWQTVLVEGHDFGHLGPFLLSFLDGVHPSNTGPQGCELVALKTGHSGVKALRDAYLCGCP